MHIDQPHHAQACRMKIVVDTAHSITQILSKKIAQQTKHTTWKESAQAENKQRQAGLC